MAETVQPPGVKRALPVPRYVESTYSRLSARLEIRHVHFTGPMKKTRQQLERNTIGKRIRLARLKCTPPVSQDDLAGRLAGRGVFLDQTAISRIENQTRYLMDYEIAAIAKCLKVSVGWLFGENA